MWGAIVFASVQIPGWLLFMALIPVITLHSSLQHECIHGHPFESQVINDILAFMPMGLFLPYLRYKELHLAHHQKASITDPLEDPESWYLTADQWQNTPKPLKMLLQVNNTLLGRFVLGPLLGTGRMVLGDISKMRQGNKQLVLMWTSHLFTCAVLLSILGAFGHVSLLMYFAAAYVGMSILMIRTYLEHQSHPSMRARSVIIEDRGLLSYLFLNNNLHAIHHAYPTVAWYQLPGLFRKNREQFLSLNRGYRFGTYGDVIRQYAWVRKEPVIFPNKTRQNRDG
ncbi:fatty acid desaturase [Sneathiella marina]|uniref:Fatty acid desaturase n=1 Tax=Sneathiella marina TaxID=2950108 RepID=A0ABY4W4F1_9PROT|nr:fatty acid desaturase [Sneathiella marina]USG61711.1 fatty acid desaturase [Sneathiella marina]